MVLQLEDTARRAKEACDLRAELMALKQIGIIQGLSANDNDDMNKIMIGVIEREHKRIESHEHSQE